MRPFRRHLSDHRLHAQLIRFGLVGLVNTALSYAIYALLLALGLPFRLAYLGALVLGIAISFISQGRLVFGEGSAARLPRFVALWAALYFVNTAVIGWIMAAGFDAYAAGALALVPITAISFVAQRYLVFRRPQSG